jgi:hypothetical protein
MINKVSKKNRFFINNCKEIFKFLINEYEFKLAGTHIENLYLEVVFKNKTTAIAIRLEERDGGITVELIKLINGDIPSGSIFIFSDTKLNLFDLEILLAIRDASQKIEHPNLDDLVFKPGWEKVMRRVLKQFARAVKQYADDVLRGDFSVFPELEKIVKSRTVKPKINIYYPVEASDIEKIGEKRVVKPKYKTIKIKLKNGKDDYKKKIINAIDQINLPIHKKPRAIIPKR